MNKNEAIFLSCVGLAIGLVLLSNSQRTGASRTVAKYITQHSAISLVGLLVA